MVDQPSPRLIQRLWPIKGEDKAERTPGTFQHEAEQGLKNEDEIPTNGSAISNIDATDGEVRTFAVTIDADDDSADSANVASDDALVVGRGDESTAAVDAGTMGRLMMASNLVLARMMTMLPGTYTATMHQARMPTTSQATHATSE